ncbi:hypothetical protein CG006_02440 [Mesoplasma florum]|uniref:lipoprotein n=1 Tax=Mesoplasma florum TaxID=2151 RepID=UPI000D02ADB4|nr:lipoprotein [Mesoplasma florum]AVN63825.1 hypothetical protein CG006_02440 [Mesoplasma florum]
MKKLLSIIGAVGLSTTATAPILNYSTEAKIQGEFNNIEDSVNLDYGINSMSPNLWTNDLRRINLMNTFSGNGTEVVESNYKVEAQNYNLVQTLVQNSKIDTMSYGGIFNIDAETLNQRFTSILLVRDQSQNTNNKAVFNGQIYKNDVQDNLLWKIEIKLTYNLTANSKAVIDVDIKQTVVDGYKYVNPITQDTGVKISFKSEFTTFFINNNIPKNQDLGDELIQTVYNMSSSNSAVVTTKDRVIKESVSGLTGLSAKQNGVKFKEVKRVSFYGQLRHAVYQMNYRNNIMLDAIEFIKNEELSTENNLVFETNYQVISQNETYGSFNSTLKLTLNINIDPVTDIVSFSNKGVIDLDNTETINPNTWMETTWIFNRASFWA